MGFISGIKDIGRFEKILSVLVKYEMGYIVDKIKLKHLLPIHQRIQKNKFKKENTEPVALCNIFEELGGAFLKLGQLLSLRPDLIPHDYCEAFKKLQDHIKPFSGDEAKKIVEKEISKKFSYFKIKPIASGSIAQVHEAVLPNTKKVIVKVQRPDAEEKFKRDIDLMKYIANLIEKRYSNLSIEPNEIVNEFERYSINEFNFLKEAKNIEKFHYNFKDDPIIKIPKVFLEFSNNKILTLEYIHGQNIEKLISEPYKLRKRLANQVSNMMFKQIFIHGFFHADPHPGNIFVIKKEIIALLDFGIVGKVSEEEKEQYLNLVNGLVNKDSDMMVKSLIKLNFKKESKININQLKEDLDELTDNYFDTNLENFDVGLFVHEIFHISIKNKLKIPTDFVLLGKALLTVEGFCAELDPKFNIVTTLKPFVEEIKMKELGPIAIIKKNLKIFNQFKDMILEIPNLTNNISDSLNEAENNIQEINKDIRNLNSNINRSVDIIALVMLTVGFLIASVMMMNFGEPIIYGIPIIPFMGFCTSGIFFVILLFALLAKTR